MADRIAYINHDIDDALRAGLLTEKDLPRKELKILGNTCSERINTMISSIYRESGEKNAVAMEKDILAATENLRTFMFEKIYITEDTKKEEEKAYRMLSAMFDYFIKTRKSCLLFICLYWKTILPRGWYATICPACRTNTPYIFSKISSYPRAGPCRYDFGVKIAHRLR